MINIEDDTVPIVPSASERRRRLIWPLIFAAIVAVVVLLLTATGRPEAGILGSGSTLAQPLVQRTSVDFRNAASADNPDRPQQSGSDWVVDGSGIGYEAVGSLGGIVSLTDGRVAFALADYPLSQAELDSREIVQAPLVIGAIAVVTHPDVVGGGAEAALRLDAETLGDIYLGEITSWDDPRIAELNPELDLPSTEIVPVHRGDGSGSTFGFTQYLDRPASAWSVGPGSGALVEWPEGIGRSADGSGSIVDAVSETPGAIGYVDVGQAERASLPVAALRNGGDRFEAPDPEAVEAAVAEADWSSDDHYTTPAVGADTAQGYPLTVAVYGMVKRSTGSHTDQVLSYLSYLLEEADAAAVDLGYLPLPEAGRSAVRKYWAEQLDYR